MKWYDQDDPAEQLRGGDAPLWLGAELAGDRLDEIVVPTLVLADLLDEWMAMLSPRLSEQPAATRETYLDLLVGLCAGADAMRAMASGDITTCIDSMQTAVRLLASVSPDRVAIPVAPSDPADG